MIEHATRAALVLLIGVLLIAMGIPAMATDETAAVSTAEESARDSSSADPGEQRPLSRKERRAQKKRQKQAARALKKKKDEAEMERRAALVSEDRGIVCRFEPRPAHTARNGFAQPCGSARELLRKHVASWNAVLRHRVAPGHSNLANRIPRRGTFNPRRSGEVPPCRGLATTACLCADAQLQTVNCVVVLRDISH